MLIKQRLLFLFCVGLHFLVTAQNSTGTLKVTGGVISGTANHNIRVYKGIPFAAPPLGNLRWKAPQPVQPWAGVKKCDAFSASPMQSDPVPFGMWSAEFLIPKQPISEDCLYLNVWTGAASPKEKRPVFVWIYGGGFSGGGSAVPIYDGEAMAAKGIVFVSLNYRVNVFGFLALDSLTKESPQHSSGNYGLMDQIAALQWVKQNIAAFGGDPDNVTIAGQSAGSMSVNCLVASPLAKGLFVKAIAESGAGFGRNYMSLPEAQNEGKKTMENLQVSSLEELRKMSAEDVFKKAKGSFAPIVDGYVLPSSITDIFAQGKENKVSLLTGWNQDEGLLFSPLKNSADYTQQIQQQYGNKADSVLYYYPATTDSLAGQSQLNLSRDMIFGAPNYTWANVASKTGPVYVYRFTHKPPATGEYKKFGAFHTGEVAYALNTLQFINRPWQPYDFSLATTMNSYWINFIKTGNPNGNGLPNWPAYDTHNKQVMMFNEQPAAEAMKDAAALDYLYSTMGSK